MIGPLTTLANEIRQINRNNGWNPLSRDNFFNKPEKVLASLMLIVTEVAEAAEEVRVGNIDRFATEMADVLIRLLDCVGEMATDFDDVVNSKMNVNRGRSHRHGGKKI